MTILGSHVTVISGCVLCGFIRAQFFGSLNVRSAIKGSEWYAILYMLSLRLYSNNDPHPALKLGWGNIYDPKFRFEPCWCHNTIGQNHTEQSFKLLFDVLHAHMVLLRVKVGNAEYTCVDFQRKWRCRNLNSTHLKNGNMFCLLHAFWMN